MHTSNHQPTNPHVVCGKFRFSAIIWRKLWLRLIECFQVLTARLLLVKECVVSGFNASRAVSLISRTGTAVEKRKSSKIPNWRYYLLKTNAKCKKNWQNHWEWLNKPFRNASKPLEWFRSKEIRFRTRGFTSHCDRRWKMGPLR